MEVRDGVVRRRDGVLAGSVLSMLDAVRNLVALGAPLEQALDAAARVPARAGRVSGAGSLVPGSLADVVVLDDALEVVRVLVGGR